MLAGIFGEYNQAIDEIKVKLLNLYNKFQGCRLLLENDYRNGLVSKQEYDYVKKLSIFSYDQAVNSKYMLSKEEAMFVKLYGDFTVSGELSAEMVNKKYLDKQKTLNNIGDSVRIFYFLENVSEKRRKEVFKSAVREFYDPQIKDCEREIEKLKNVFGANYYSSITYQKINVKYMSLINGRRKFIEQTNTSNLREFMALVQEFYGLNIDFYYWYKRRFVREECESEISTTDQGMAIDQVQSMIEEQNTQERETFKINRDISNIATLITSLMGEIVSDSLNDNDDRIKPFFRRKKGKQNNQDVLLSLFTYYTNYPIFVKYLEQFGTLGEDGSLKTIFTKYYETHYNGCAYVDPRVFKKRLLLDVINYLKSLIDDLNEKMQKTNNVLKENNEALNNKVKEVKRYEDIRKYYDVNRNDILGGDKILLDLGFSEEEIKRIYSDLREYITINLTKEYLDGPILNMKVGN